MALFTKLQIGDRIQINVPGDRADGATGIILERDGRFGYGDGYWDAMPDDPRFANPGPVNKNWCINEKEDYWIKIGSLSTEELLTSEHRSLRQEGQRRLKQEKRQFSLSRIANYFKR